MIRLSKMRNTPVICCKQQTGLLQGMLPDAARKRVQALIVSCGIRGKRIVPAACVQAIDEGFILVDRVEKVGSMDMQTAFPFVRDTTGMLAGRVTDYAIDEATLQILAAEVMPGYWPAASRRRFWVYAYRSEEKAQGDLIVPVSCLSWADCFEGGNLKCAYPP